MMGKIVERFSMIRLIKCATRNARVRSESRSTPRDECDITVKQARLGANIEVTADPLLMLSVFITLYVGISVLGMTLAQLGLCCSC